MLIKVELPKCEKKSPSHLSWANYAKIMESSYNEY